MIVIRLFQYVAIEKPESPIGALLVSGPRGEVRIELGDEVARRGVMVGRSDRSDAVRAGSPRAGRSAPATGAQVSKSVVT